MTAFAKVFGRLRTKNCEAGTREARALCYGLKGFRMVSDGVACRCYVR